MITSDRCEPQSLAICVTASRMLEMSLACTPQSISICLAPPELGTDSRKKSPKPTRNMRTRKPVADAKAGGGCAGPAPGAGPALRRLRGVFAVLATAFLAAIAKLPRAADRN